VAEPEERYARLVDDMLAESPEDVSRTWRERAAMVRRRCAMLVKGRLVASTPDTGG
jgi:hypothetical protein